MRIDAENLLENSKLNVNKPKQSNNKVLGIVIAIIITIAIICVLVVMLQEVQTQGLKIYVNGEEAKIDSSIFLFENDKLYVNVKGIAKHIGYDAHSGEFKIEAEDANKVFVENKQETASMFLNSNVISKTTQNINDEYKNYEMSEPAREVNGEIYIISDGIQIACNSTILYDKTKNTINIITLDYYYEAYNKVMQEKGMKQLSDNFENKKAMLYDRLVVEDADGEFGVFNAEGKEIIGTRYKYIQFDEYTQEFTITNNDGKVGIDYIDGGTKIEIVYDEIKSIDKKDGLYLIKKNNKYGVIDNKEKIIIHAEYDEIGVNIEPYSPVAKTTNTATTNQNNSSNWNESQEEAVKQYVFFNSIIPVKQNELWGFFDVKGTKMSELKYTGIGCMAKVEENTGNKKNNTVTTPKKTTSNLLLIDEYELIVVEKDEKYGLIDANAKEIIQAATTDMYSITNAGVKTYYMILNGNVYNLETDLFEKMGLKKKTDDVVLEQQEETTEQNQENKNSNEVNNTVQESNETINN